MCTVTLTDTSAAGNRDLTWKEISAIPARSEVTLIPYYGEQMLGNSIKLLYYQSPTSFIQSCLEELSFIGQTDEREIRYKYPPYINATKHHDMRPFIVTSSKVKVLLCNVNWQMAFAFRVRRIKCKSENVQSYVDLRSFRHKVMYNWCRYIHISTNDSAVVKLDYIDRIKVFGLGNCSNAKFRFEIYDLDTVTMYTYIAWYLTGTGITYRPRCRVPYIIVSILDTAFTSCRILIKRMPPISLTDWSEIKPMLDVYLMENKTPVHNNYLSFLSEEFKYVFKTKLTEFLFFMSTHLHTWEYASKYCKDWGGTLLTFKSVDEIDTIKHALESNFTDDIYPLIAIYIGMKKEVFKYIFYILSDNKNEYITI